jgi:hypothetical protein
MTDQLTANMDTVLAAFGPNVEGGAYLTKSSLATALIHPDEAERQRALQLALNMILLVADPDTLYLGEVFVAMDEDGDGEPEWYDNRVSTPHLWAATLVYLTLMASYHPDRFDPSEELLPAAELPDDIEPPEIAPDAGPDGGIDAGPDASPDGGDEMRVMSARGGACGCRAGSLAWAPSWLGLFDL